MLPSLSRWLTHTIRLRDSVRQANFQVQQRSRDVGGSPERPCLARGDCCPPGKGCNRAGPFSRDEAGILQPLLHRTQERWWPSANPGSASLVQNADAQAHDQMHSAPGFFCCDRPEGRLLSRFDPSTTQTVPTVCVRRSGMAVQGPPLRALPVYPCVHGGRRKCPYPVTGSGHQNPQLPRRLAYPSPIQRAVGRSQGLGASAPQPVGASGQLGKSKLSPVQRISFLCVELDSVSMMGCLTEDRAQAVLNCPSSFSGRNVVPLKQFQRHLGHMASAAAVTPLGLVHMRPLQHWLQQSPSSDLAFLWAGVPLDQVSRRYMQWAGSLGLWTGPRLLWHINYLELWAVHLALQQFWPLLLGKHVLVRTDNTVAVSYINRLGGIRSHRMSQLARHLLLWSHTQFKSLRAVHIPGKLNHAANALSRQLTFPGEWRLHPETIRLIWS